MKDFLLRAAMKHSRNTMVMLCILLFLIAPVSAVESDGIKSDRVVFGFWPDGKYVSGIPVPSGVLGFPVGSKPARAHQVVAYMRELASSSEEVVLEQYGETYEGQPLYYVVISDVKNMRNLENIRESIRKLADPRKLDQSEDVSALISRTPAVAWMGYSIHGDELSSTDAALGLMYQLAAGQDEVTKHLKSNLIICIDPLQNPDGRERFLHQIRQWSGRVENSDVQSMQHEGSWPWGRGNHYLYDLNRDWMLLVNKETRGKVKAVVDWCPQLLVDSHEMGPFSTYLFSPPREPVNLNITPKIKKWRERFAKDQAAAFDRFGWSYYTGDWHEEWYPGYGSSWANFLGAIGILYEQAGVHGSVVKRRDSTVLTYRESVHHQFISSMANLKSLADYREDILRDYYEDKLSWITAKNYEVLMIDPGRNLSRANRFIQTLMVQGVEVYRAEDSFTGMKCRNIWGSELAKKTFKPGTFIIPTKQPLAPLIHALCDFDPRLSDEFIREERLELEKKGDTRLYEITSWSLPVAYALDAYWSEFPPKVDSQKIDRVEFPSIRTESQDPQYGYIFDTMDDGSIHTLLYFLKEGFTVRVCEKPFTIDDNTYAAGTVLLRKKENPANLNDFVQWVSAETGIPITGVDTALTDDGPDLGSGHFKDLAPPRIAVLTGAPLNFTQFGAIWHLLDEEFRLRISTIECFRVGHVDLSKYNVLVMPSSWWDPMGYQRILGSNGIDKIKQWVKEGGTLIAIGNGAVFAADENIKLSKVALRRQVLTGLAEYERAVAVEKAAISPEINIADIWTPGSGKDDKQKTDTSESEPAGKPQISEEELKEQDTRTQLFMPRGVILQGNVNQEHWLCFGMDEKVPFIVYTPYALLSKPPVETPIRFAEEPDLRVSGLLWPEARKRWADSAYLTREGFGKGQIIMFAGPPDFRSYFHGTRRLFLNALFLGPGFGTHRPAPW